MEREREPPTEVALGHAARLQHAARELVLQGEAQFVTPDGPMPVIRKHQALFIPKGAFYSFSAGGTENLVLARFGANPPGRAHGRRLDPNGNFIPGRAQKDGAVKPHFIEGKFFE